MLYKTIIMLALIVAAIAGCSLISSYSPAKIPTELTGYLGADTSEIVWPCLGKLESLKGEAISKNITVQLDCKAIMEKDEALYKLAIEQANINLETAKAEWTTAVGTVNQPGWLLSALIGAGGLVGGRALTQLTHYSENEVTQIKADIVKTNGAKV